MTAERKPSALWPPMIRPAEERDLQALPALENSAGMLFTEIPELAWLADGEDLSVSRYRELVAQGYSWVAVDPGHHAIAFLCATVEEDELHIWEVGVRRDMQRRGIGRQLIGQALRSALHNGLCSITLTTFRDVPWNAPFYSNLGFEMLEGAAMGDRLRTLLEAEVERGLPLKSRCAMRLRLCHP